MILTLIILYLIGLGFLIKECIEDNEAFNWQMFILSPIIVPIIFGIGLYNLLEK